MNFRLFGGGALAARQFASTLVRPGFLFFLGISAFARDPSASVSGDAPPVDYGGAAGSSAGTYEPKVLSQMPVPLVQVRPIYPLDLQKKHESGQAVVDFVVTTRGTVANPFAIRATNREFAAAAVMAVSKWKFKPGQIDHRPVNTHMQVPIVFTLNNDQGKIPVSPNSGTDFAPGDDKAPTFTAALLDHQPVPRYQARPEYPASLRQGRIQGQAVVDFVVDENGATRQLRIAAATNPEFGDAARAAVARWIFSPGTKDGVTVRTHMQVPIVFTLGSG